MGKTTLVSLHKFCVVNCCSAARTRVFPREDSSDPLYLCNILVMFVV